MDLRLIRMFAMVCPFAISAQECSDVRDLVLRARVLSRCVLTVAAVVLSWGAGPDVAWAQCEMDEEQLLASDAAEADLFGFAVAISDDVALIGAKLDDDQGFQSGSAYVFRFNGLTWVQQQKLLASDGSSGDIFGSAVSVSGDVAIIGAWQDDHNGTDSGSAYVFRFNGSAWVEEQKLLASDGAAYDKFGLSLAVSDDVAVIGAYADDDHGSLSGSAYVFRFNGSTWVQEQKLVASDGAAYDLFGSAVAVTGDVVLIGSRQDDDNGTNTGSVYVFRFNGASWIEQTKLLASDQAPGDMFGGSVAISGDAVVIGAAADDDNGTNSGSAYVFRHDGSTWIEEAKLLASDGVTSYDKFGSSVAISGDVAVVGVPEAGTATGSAYVFRYEGSAWIEETELVHPDGAAGDRFGFSVAASGETVLVGVRGDDDNGTSSGSAWVFQDGTVGPFDLSIVLEAWGPNPGHPADFNGDGVVDASDLAIVLGEWRPCP